MLNTINSFNTKEFVLNHVPKEYTVKDTYGLWQINTYDYDGTTDYGIYEGYIDDIAFTIKVNNPNADYTELYFTPVNIKYPINQDTVPVNITCKICIPFSGPKYIIDMEDKKDIYTYIFKNRPVMVEANGVMILRKPGTSEEETEYKRQAILAKLTKEERELLGFTN